MKGKAHFTARDILKVNDFGQKNFGRICLITGRMKRALMCVDFLSKVRKSSFWMNSFWSGEYKGKKVTVVRGGEFAPGSAIIAELLCAAGVNVIIRIGTCGVLREDILPGTYVLADEIISGDGTTPHYVPRDFRIKTSVYLNTELFGRVSSDRLCMRGKVFTTDALFRETEEFLSGALEKGAVAVDMASAPLVTVCNVYGRVSAVILTASDNLVNRSFAASYAVKEAEEFLISRVYEVIAGIEC